MPSWREETKLYLHLFLYKSYLIILVALWIQACLFPSFPCNFDITHLGKCALKNILLLAGVPTYPQL
jgi:hypothetical protein